MRLPLELSLTVVSLITTARGLASALPDGSVEQRAAAELADALVAYKRATAQAPNGYTPASVNCPSTRPSIRHAGSLSPEELAWLPVRRNNTIAPMRDLLGRLNIAGLDTNSWMDTWSKNASALPNIGIAASGGGYRAMLNGGGNIAALDSRTRNSTGAGHLGGLLQSATYFAGLSGGNWLVGSIYVNNFTSIQAIMDTNEDQSGSLWQLGNPIYEGPAKKGIQLLNTAEYWSDLVDTVGSKSDAGWNTSLTDYWGRALSYQFVNASRGGPGFTWSSLQDDSAISQGNAPLPIVVADGRAPGELLISSNTTVFEFTPWEMGSYDPALYGFAPLRYVGSNFTAGALPSDQPCISGFDNVGFVMGTSSSLFNQFLLNLNSTSIPSAFRDVIAKILGQLGQDNNDIADWNPNPFYQYNSAENRAATSRRLTLVDGGEDLQNIPLYPLIQPLRNVDVIFAIDSSADTVAPAAAGWPNGTAMVATYERSLNISMENGTLFPAIPDQNTFVNLGLNNRPTFFGCNSSNMTGSAPIVVYLPNSPYVYNSNVSTYDLEYNNTERNAIITNGYNVATMGNGTRDSMWPTCVGCAILSRSLERTNTQIPSVCQQCFQKYCWDGTVNSTAPNPYDPSSVMAQIKVAGVGKMGPSGALAIAVAFGTALLMSF